MWFLFPTVAFSETEVDTPCKLLHIPSAMKFTSCRFHSSVKISFCFILQGTICVIMSESPVSVMVFFWEKHWNKWQEQIWWLPFETLALAFCVLLDGDAHASTCKCLEVHVSILFHDRCLETEQGLCCQSDVAMFICSICLRLLWLWSCCFRCSLFLQVLATKHVVFVASQLLRMCWFCKMTSVCS